MNVTETLFLFVGFDCSPTPRVPGFALTKILLLETLEDGGLEVRLGPGRFGLVIPLVLGLLSLLLGPGRFSLVLFP